MLDEGRRFAMNNQNEIKGKEKNITFTVVLYNLINIIYFLLFLRSCPFALLSPMALASGEGLNAWISFILLAGFPIIIIGIMWGARYFYRKEQIKAAFQVLLLPPLFYIVFLILQAVYWELYS